MSKATNWNSKPFRVPLRVQDTIPVRRIWTDGIFQVGKQFSKTYSFADINYRVASEEDQKAMFHRYEELLNSFDGNATTKITIHNRRANQSDLEQHLLGPLKGDAQDVYRKEWNQLLIDKTLSDQAMLQSRYLTVTIDAQKIDQARSYFKRTDGELRAHFAKLGSNCVELDASERLRIFHDFYRQGEESSYFLDLKEMLRHGADFRDAVCPDSMKIEPDCFKIGGRYGRVLFLKAYATYISDRMVSDFTALCAGLMLSVDVKPVAMDVAVREVENCVLGCDTNITNWQRRQNDNQNFSAAVPYDLALQKKESDEYLKDLTERDQRMMLATITIIHTADSKKQLDADTQTLQTIALKYSCQMAVLRYQQLDGLITTLPFGLRRIDVVRTLTTEGVAAFIPFYVQEIRDEHGIYCGENAISHNLIFCDKGKLMNPNAIHLGVPGSGKSMLSKILLVYIFLFTDDDILVFDPEAEYSPLAKAFGGQVIKIAAGSKDHINALDMVDGYADGGDPVRAKSEFVLSLFDQLKRNGIEPEEQSIIDRCLELVYADYKRGGPEPTLRVLREQLLRQPEPQAKKLALVMEIFTNGSLDAFAYPTNVDTQNRFVVYDTLNLGRQLKTLGLLVITDAMLNRVAENWKKGKRTHLIIDEFHVIFESEYSASFFNSAWRRFRKRNAFPTAITQNVEYLLDSVMASTMLSNSEFIVMLNQAPSDRERLAQLLNISKEQLSYITNAEAGSGLIRYGKSLVPFVNRFPKSTKLYKLMTTKPDEKLPENESEE